MQDQIKNQARREIIRQETRKLEKELMTTDEKLMAKYSKQRKKDAIRKKKKYFEERRKREMEK